MTTDINQPAPVPRFEMGTLCLTPGVIHELEQTQESALALFSRHASCDWGDVSRYDARANDWAIADEGNPDRQERVFSVYHSRRGTKMYVITEADRSVTTLLLADEY